MGIRRAVLSLRAILAPFYGNRDTETNLVIRVKAQPGLSRALF